MFDGGDRSVGLAGLPKSREREPIGWLTLATVEEPRLISRSLGQGATSRAAQSLRAILLWVKGLALQGIFLLLPAPGHLMWTVLQAKTVYCQERWST